MTDATLLPIDDDQANTHEDTGGILVFVLVVATLVSLIVLPMLNYTMAVYKSGQVQSNRGEAIEFANGGTWVAMANERQLYDLCEDPDLSTTIAEPVTLPSSLPGVTTTCQLLDTAALRPATEMPFHVATVQADKQIPSAHVTTETYVNPNTPGDPFAWLSTPDWTPAATASKVWIPQLPVQSISNGANRATRMRPGTFDTALYPSCRVYFPGTFNTEIVIDEPAYFTSGVYYFTEPVVLRDGADVVVGNGEDLGCTTDFEAASPLAETVPEPLNISGLGGTFVLGGNARIIVDDSGAGDIRFAINQRYVSTEETSVQASSDVAIVSVNGQHEPLSAGESLGDDFIVPGVIGVPASTVGTDGDPPAVSSNYVASVLTAKPDKPDAPVITALEPYQVDSSNNRNVDDGILVIDWDAPADNGALITGYTATDAYSGTSCTVSVPSGSGLTVPTACLLKDLEHQNGNVSNRPQITVTATNDYGLSDPSLAFDVPANMPRIDLRSSGVPQMSKPRKPTATGLGTSYSDGLEVTWTPPDETDRGPTTGYRVTAVPFLDPLDLLAVLGPDVTCDARFDETNCFLALDPSAYGYDIAMVALGEHGLPGDLNVSGVESVASAVVFAPGPNPSPPRVPQTASGRIPIPILDFTVGGSATMDIRIDGYISVPQGRILVDAATPATSSVVMSGGVLAGQLDIDPTNAPATTIVEFDNPVAQKRVRIQSSYSGLGSASSDAVIQVNRSGSLAVNSWIVQ